MGKILCRQPSTPHYAPAHGSIGANTDPAAVFSTGETFAALWAATISPIYGGAFSCTPLPRVQIGGKWYYGAGVEPAP